MTKNNTALGRDFWIYQFGQAVSVVGDGCSSVALAWWVLSATGSASKMGFILGSSVLSRVALTVFFGPFGDRYSRKKLVIAGDLLRGMLTLAMMFFVYAGIFSMPLVVSVMMLLGAGSALFSAGSGGLVPKLVAPANMRRALQYANALMSCGGLAGMALGGCMVSLAGAGGAFAFDAVSFFAASAASMTIAADTVPDRKAPGEAAALRRWYRELKGGLRAIWRAPVIFWVTMLAGFMNFASAPIVVALPVLIKQEFRMSAACCGVVMASLSLGMIAGSLVTSLVCRFIKPDQAMVAGLFLMGAGMAVLPWHPSVPLMSAVMLFCGILNAIVNIVLDTQITLSLPDSFRSRVSSAGNAFCGILTPPGMWIAGLLAVSLGASSTIFIGGVAFALSAPLLYLIPRFAQFYRTGHEHAPDFFKQHYPDAFTESAATE